MLALYMISLIRHEVSRLHNISFGAVNPQVDTSAIMLSAQPLKILDHIYHAMV